MKSDADLLRRAPRDPDAFAQFCERHVAALHAWLVRELSDFDVASDITSETLAQAWRSVKRFRDPGDGNGSRWLNGIARNLLRRYYRSQKIETRARKRLGMRLETSVSHDEEVIERITARSVGLSVNEALERLPIGQRQAVRLRVIEEKPYDDIAAELNCSAASARMQVTRALRNLKLDLDGVKV